MRYAGEVVNGKGRGKRIGFPTLNFKIPEHFAYPYGIYAGWVISGSEQHEAVFHYGPIPTFHEETPSLEAFLLYGVVKRSSAISFELVRHLREIQMFETVDALTDQIKEDIRKTREILGRRMITQT